MKIAVDVCIGIRGIKRMREAGHDVVVEAEHGEPDDSWFARAVRAGAEVVVSGDRDLEILCYDHRVRFIEARRHLRGVNNAERVIHRLRRWAVYDAVHAGRGGS